MKLQVTRARGSDAVELRRVAIDSKSHWGYPPQWLERFAALFELTSEQVESRPCYCIRDRRILGWYSLKPSGMIAILDDLWVAPSEIGRGLGRILFEHALERARELGALRMEWEADPNAVPFYKHMGGVVTGDIETAMGRRIPTMAVYLDPS
jgi:GNAT superfamily N-acetyltransferase